MGKLLNRTTSLSAGWVDPAAISTTEVLLTQEAQLAFADTWETRMCGEPGKPLCIFRLFQQEGANSCSKEMLSHLMPPARVGEKLPLT